MTLQLNVPHSLAKQAREPAERQHVSADQLVAAALTAQIRVTASRPSIAGRARRRAPAPVRRAHSSVVPGGAAAKDASGKFIHEAVWRYLFTHPVEQVGQPVPHDPNTPMDLRSVEQTSAKARK